MYRYPLICTYITLYFTWYSMILSPCVVPILIGPITTGTPQWFRTFAPRCTALHAVAGRLATRHADDPMAGRPALKKGGSWGVYSYQQSLHMSPWLVVIYWYAERCRIIVLNFPEFIIFPTCFPFHHGILPWFSLCFSHRFHQPFTRVGYWKLPAEDMTSKDLSGKIISKARQGTAPVDKSHLHEVYVALGGLERWKDPHFFLVGWRYPLVNIEKTMERSTMFYQWVNPL